MQRPTQRIAQIVGDLRAYILIWLVAIRDINEGVHDQQYDNNYHKSVYYTNTF